MLAVSRDIFRTCQISKMECFEKLVNSFKPLTIFAKRCILDVSQGSAYASGVHTFSEIETYLEPYQTITGLRKYSKDCDTRPPATNFLFPIFLT